MTTQNNTSRPACKRKTMSDIYGPRAGHDITERDNYIRNQALLYAIAHIQSLPKEKQEFSNMCEMCALVLAERSIFTFQQIAAIEIHDSQKINLWPVEVADHYSPQQLAQKAEWEPMIERTRSQLAEIMAEAIRKDEEMKRGRKAA